MNFFVLGFCLVSFEFGPIFYCKKEGFVARKWILFFIFSLITHEWLLFIGNLFAFKISKVIDSYSFNPFTSILLFDIIQLFHSFCVSIHLFARIRFVFYSFLCKCNDENQFCFIFFFIFLASLTQLRCLQYAIHRIIDSALKRHFHHSTCIFNVRAL